MNKTEVHESGEREILQKKNLGGRARRFSDSVKQRFTFESRHDERRHQTRVCSSAQHVCLHKGALISLQ